MHIINQLHFFNVQMKHLVFSGCYSNTTGGVVQPCADVTVEVVGSAGVVKASVSARFYLLVGCDTRSNSFLMKLLWPISGMSGQYV